MIQCYIFFFTPKPKYAKQFDANVKKPLVHGPLNGVVAKFVYDICQTKNLIFFCIIIFKFIYTFDSG